MAMLWKIRIIVQSENQNFRHLKCGLKYERATFSVYQGVPMTMEQRPMWRVSGKIRFQLVKEIWLRIFNCIHVLPKEESEILVPLFV